MRVPRPPVCMVLCLFCAAPAVEGRAQCAFHRHRAKCVGDPLCLNQVYARQRCVRHGGKKLCTEPGCRRNARNNSLCFRHAAAVAPPPACAVDGCGKPVHAKGKCLPHSGVRRCREPLCNLYARHAGFCTQHRRPSRPSSSPPLLLHERDADDGWFEDFWSRVPYPPVPCSLPSVPKSLIP
ncbi:hypothetical protein ACHHYP_05929 [Achlya hypogyna]|uniref:Secreted protein n=1 Tax=Achlya hypogyna TaxID=1202772 RepID=A0A1V9YVR2_ACHHY|nr:hypothetical protein ACHHYP_05929 [Achlya hypogyna]